MTPLAGRAGPYPARPHPHPTTPRKDHTVSYPQYLTPAEALVKAKRDLGIPTVVVICGSTRYMQAMTDLDRLLTWTGNIVIKPGCDMKTPHELWDDPTEAEAGKQRLDDLHRAKIRLADVVYVVGTHIGDSTRAEIAYAESLGLPIRYVPGPADLLRARADEISRQGAQTGGEQA